MEIKTALNKKITQKDIALAANVSSATVSLALANSPKIPEETKYAVQNIATQLGYQATTKK